MTLAEILSPVGVPQFLSTHLGMLPLHVEGEAARFAPLVAEHGGPVARLTRDIEHTVEAAVRRGGDAALPAACDRLVHDALVLQLDGDSRLEVWDRTMAAAAGPARVMELAAGHLGYVPRGWWLADADRRGAAESRRVVFSIELSTGQALLAFLFKMLSKHEFFAGTIPRFAPLAVQADYVTTFRQTIAGACRTPGLLALHGWQSNNAAAPAPAPAPGPDARAAGVSEGDMIEYLVTRHLHPWRGDPKTLTFKFNGKDLRFPLDAAQLLDFLEEQAPVAVSAFYATFEDEFDRDELEDFLLRLAEEGMLALVSAGTA